MWCVRSCGSIVSEKPRYMCRRCREYFVEMGVCRCGGEIVQVLREVIGEGQEVESALQSIARKRVLHG